MTLVAILENTQTMEELLVSNIETVEQLQNMLNLWTHAIPTMDSDYNGQYIGTLEFNGHSESFETLDSQEIDGIVETVQEWGWDPAIESSAGACGEIVDGSLSTIEGLAGEAGEAAAADGLGELLGLLGEILLL